MVFEIIHLIKRIAPEMAVFINPEPKPFEDVRKAHDKVVKILDKVMEMEIDILRENRNDKKRNKQ